MNNIKHILCTNIIITHTCPARLAIDHHAAARMHFLKILSRNCPCRTPAHQTTPSSETLHFRCIFITEIMENINYHCKTVT